jgi:glycosyltransferase involved in cell wall biosynthesis
MIAKPRVLLVVGFLWGDEGIVRGLITLAKGLMESGWEVALASAMVDQDDYDRFTRGPKWIESQGIKHFSIPFPGFRTSAGTHTSDGKFSTALKALFSLNTFVQQFKPDIINVHSLSLCPYAFVMRSLYGIPYVSTARVIPSVDRLGVKFGAFINKYFKTFLGNRSIAISSEIKEAYERILRIPPGQVKVVCHGVETDQFRPPSGQERLESREAFGLIPEDKVVCLIGRLYPIKGHDVLIQAISLLRSERINVIALCAGAGDKVENQTLQTQAEQSGVSDLIRLLGFTDARQVLWASDVLVLPSRLEGFGWVIPEAMLCGVVPIRTPSAGAVDQVNDGVNGFIVPFNDPQFLALRLKQLLENEEIRSRMAANAIEYARQKFTVERMVKDTIEVYNDVVKTEK